MFIPQVRVYALHGDGFGRVVCAKAIRAAHCLTSIQFSPSSQHLLLAYGRRARACARGTQFPGGCGSAFGGRDAC